MTEQKPIRTFTLCDEAGNKYEVNEFKFVAVIDQTNLTEKPHHIVNTYYSASTGDVVELENDEYYLQTTNGEKILLYSDS